MALHSVQRFALRSLTALALIVAFGWSTARAQSVDSGLNVIHIRFDTLKLTPTQTYVLMPVKWSSSLPKPHDFRGFNVHFRVDSIKVTVSQFLTQGTASDAMQGTPFTNTKDSDIFVILGSQEPDFNNPVLFYVAVSVHLNPGEVTPFHWLYIEDPKYFKVDTIIAEDGWIKLEAPKTATVTSRDTTMKADSLISIPILVSDLSGTNVTQARLSATIDTSVFDLVGATPGSESNSQVVAQVTGNLLTVDVSAATPGTLTGNGILANVLLRAKPRQDTACGAFSNASFTPLNSGAYLGSVSVFLGEICVFGKPPAAVQDRGSVARLEVYPNPATSVVHLGDASRVKRLRVYDVLGNEVFSGSNVAYWKPSPALASGRYRLDVISTDGEEKQADVIIVHTP